MSRAFHLFSRFVLAVGVLLIWWGAAVTTEDVGLAVPDWPLCFGKINPEGWHKVPALLLEHGHRWIATTIGVLVLIQYLWVQRKHQPNSIEVAIILLCGTGYLILVYMGALLAAATIAVLAFAWLFMTWLARKWHVLRGLTTLSLLLVIMQASLGGLRVLKMSNAYGIVHGTLGQLFYCLLILIAFASSQTWESGRLHLSTTTARKARFWSLALFLCVFMQLIIGATLRHTQRHTLAASDILTTQGHYIPPTTPADAFVLFLHKVWGFFTAVLLIIVARWAHRWLITLPSLRWVPVLLLYLPALQVTLGIFVILTGKSFWVTNFHVINGLALIAFSFILAATVWGSHLRTPQTAEP
jgi:cytochrome c oxidase assembly protein subunit 15